MRNNIRIRILLLWWTRIWIRIAKNDRLLIRIRFDYRSKISLESKFSWNAQWFKSFFNNITNIKFTLRFLYLAKKKRVKEVGSGYEMFSRFGSGSVFSPRLVSGSATLLQICQFHTLSFPDNAINIITAINFCQKKLSCHTGQE